MQPKLGRVYKVKNKNAKWGSLAEYNYFTIVDPWGVKIRCMATDKEILNLEERAAKHPEDHVKKISLRDWLKR